MKPLAVRQLGEAEKVYVADCIVEETIEATRFRSTYSHHSGTCPLDLQELPNIETCLRDSDLRGHIAFAFLLCKSSCPDRSQRRQNHYNQHNDKQMWIEQDGVVPVENCVTKSPF